jgi:plastocyanin
VESSREKKLRRWKAVRRFYIAVPISPRTRSFPIRLPGKEEKMSQFLLLPAVLVVVLGAVAPSFADTTTVNALASTFSPPTVTIQVGDTVKWVRTTLSHTVTSGFSSSDPGVGGLFDAPLNALNPMFFYTFSDTVGTYPYFCRVHELMGMAGTVVVEAPATGIPIEAPGANTTWGRLKALFD